MRLIYICIVYFIVFNLYGQSLGERLNQKIKDKKNFHEIMKIVDSIYTIAGTDIRNNGGDGLFKYKHWQRWSWYNERRLDENGKIVDINKRKLELDEIRQREKSKNKGPRSYIPGSWKPIGMEVSSYSADTLMNYTTGQAGNSYANGTGRLDRIAFHPTDSNTFYVGAPIGGLWKTTDGGATWKCLTDTIPSIGVTGIVVSYANPNTVYILTGQGDGSGGTQTNKCQGVMKSTDAGLTWSFVGPFPVTPGFTNLVGFELVQNPTNDNILMAVTNDGIFRTSNSGTTWTKTRTGLHYDIAFKPNSGSVVVAASDDSLFYSTNGGISWNASTRNIAPLQPSIRINIEFSISEPNKVYAFHGNNGKLGQFAGIYISTDSGISFTRLATTPNVLGYVINGIDSSSQASYDLCMAVHPDSSSRVIIGSINIWRSSNGGATFTNNTGWYENQGAQAYVHCDQHSLAYNPLDDKLYSCNDGGIWVSSNSGNSWTNLSKGLQTGMFYTLTQYKKNTSYILCGGTQDNGVKYRPAGTKNFTHMFGADGVGAAFQPNNPNLFYATVNGGARRFDYQTGSYTYIQPPNASGINFILTHPIDTNIVFCGGNGQPIYRSINKGNNWANVGGIGNVMAISSVTPTRMFAAGGNLTYLSNNTGLTWQVDTTGLGPNLQNLTVTDIETDPFQGNYAYLTLGGFASGRKVYQTSDGGLTWINISYNLPNVVVNSIAATYDKLYIGTDITVYSKDWGGFTWVDIGDNLPHSPVIDILVDESKGNIILGTWGRGVWQRNYCVNDITLLDSLKGKLEYESTNQIIASALVPGTINFDSIFMTSSKIVLQPGFRSKKGSYMKAARGNCDNGAQPLINERQRGLISTRQK